MTQIQRSRWEHVQPKQIAIAIFDCVKGNCKKLDEPCKSDDGVWFTIVKAVNPAMTELVDRFWVSNVYHTNKKQVKDIHYNICVANKVQYIPSDIHKSVSQGYQYYCYCKNLEPVEADPEVSMLSCCTCKDWFHGICVKANPKNFLGRKTWTCPFCRKVGTKLVPLLFRSVIEDDSPRGKLKNKSILSRTISKFAPTPTKESLSHLQFSSHSTSTPLKGANRLEALISPIVYSTPGKHGRRSSSDEDRNTPPKKSTADHWKQGQESSSDESLKVPPKPSTEQQFEATTGSSGEEEHGQESSGDESLKVPPTTLTQQQKQATSGGRNDVEDQQVKVSKFTLNPNSNLDKSHHFDVSFYEGNEEDIGIADTSIDRRQDTEGPFSNHEKFKMTITFNDWTVIRPVPNPDNKARGHRFRMPRYSWGDVFQKSFKRSSDCPEYMKGCVLKMNRHKVYDQKADNPNILNYIFAEAACTREKCTMKYKFSLPVIPTGKSDVVFKVHPIGTLFHDLTLMGKRKLQGLERLRVVKSLQAPGAKPSVFRRKLFEAKETIKQAVTKRDFTQVQTVSVFRAAKKEALSLNDLHPDILVDLCLRKKQMKNLLHLQGDPCGYIQEIGVDPFYVLLYTKRQFDAFRRLLALRPSTPICLDATGNVSAKLPEYISQKILYYYALCITIPEDKESPMIPICEFITNSHSASTLGMILKIFFNRFRKCTSSKDLYCGIRYFSTDNSKALIAATQQGIGFPGKVYEYLDLAWKGLVNQEPLPFVNHICRAHAAKFLTKQIEKHFKEKIRSLILLWKKLMLFEQDMWGSFRRMKDIILIVGKQYITTDVETAVANIQKMTLQEMTDTGYPWDLMQFADLVDTDPFYARSPFGNLALKLCHQFGVPLPREIKMKQGSDESFQEFAQHDFVSSKGQKNPYYNPPFLAYLIVHIFPITPLLNHSLLYLHNMALHDTNSVSEVWNRIIKLDEHPQLPQRITRFIVSQEEVIKDRLASFDTGLLALQRIRNRWSKVNERRDPESGEEDLVVVEEADFDDNVPWEYDADDIEVSESEGSYSSSRNKQDSQQDKQDSQKDKQDSQKDKQESQKGTQSSKDKQESQKGTQSSKDKQESQKGTQSSKDKLESQKGTQSSKDKLESQKGTQSSKDKLESQKGTQSSKDKQESQKGTQSSKDKQESQKGTQSSKDTQSSKGDTTKSSNAKAKKRREIPSYNILQDVIPEDDKEGWSRRPRPRLRATPKVDGSIIHSVSRIPYGGSVVFNNREYPVSHTCNIDCPIQILYTAYKLFTHVKDYLDHFAKQNIQTGMAMVDVFNCLDQKQFDRARQITLFNLMNLNPVVKSHDLFESEDRFLKSIKFYIKCLQIRRCKNKDCPLGNKNTDMHPSTGFIVENPSDFQKYNEVQLEDCLAGCQMPSEVSYTWAEMGAPAFFAIAFSQGGQNSCQFQHLKKRLNVLGTKYQLFSFTLYRTAHFKAVFFLKGEYYVYDDQNPNRLYEFTDEDLKDAVVSSGWYILYK